MIQDENCFMFPLTDHTQQDKPGRVRGNVTLHRYSDKKLCVYETLEYYLNASDPCRSSSSLLTSYVKLYNAVTSSTINRWIKTVFQHADIDTSVFTAHSPATSKAATLVVPIDVILKTARWSAERTFRKFYNKPIVSPTQLICSVLQK